MTDRNYHFYFKPLCGSSDFYSFLTHNSLLIISDLRGKLIAICESSEVEMSESCYFNVPKNSVIKSGM